MTFPYDHEEGEPFLDDLVSLVSHHKESLHTTSSLWDPSHDLIGLSLGVTDTELESMADLLGPCKMHRKVFYRTSLCLSSLMTEMDSLTREAKEVLHPPLLLFGDHNNNNSEMSEEEAQDGFVQLVHHFEIIWCWCRRVEEVIVYAIRQLSSLYSPSHAQKNSRFYSYMEVRFSCVWRSLSHLLGAVVGLEQILERNEAVRVGFQASYKLLVYMSQYKGDQLPIASNAVKLNDFQNLLRIIRNELLNGTILRRIGALRFDTATVAVTKNNVFFTAFTEALTATVARVDTTARNSPSNNNTVLGLVGLHYLYQCLFLGASENLPSLPSAWREKMAAVLDSVVALHVKFPVLHVQGVYAFPLLSWVTARDVSKRTVETCRNVEATETDVVEQRRRLFAGNLQTEVKRWTTLISVWTADLQTTLPTDEAHTRSFVRATTLLIQRGLQLAQELQYYLVELLTLYQTSEHAKLTLPTVFTIAQGVELLMMIRGAFHTKLGILGGSYNTLVRSVAYTLEKHLYNVNIRLQEEVKRSQRSTAASSAGQDQLDAVAQSLLLLQRGNFTQDALAALDVVISIALNRRDIFTNSLSKNVISRKEYDEMFLALAQLKRIANLQQVLHDVTDCSFIYWYRQLLYPLFIRRYYKSSQHAPYLTCMIGAMQSVRETVLKAKHVEDPVDLLRAYKGFVREVLLTELIQPLCCDVENHIRVHTHTIVMSEENPRKFENGIQNNKDFNSSQDVSTFLRLPPFSFFDSWFDIAAQVERYLSRQFYNLNALAPKDWKIYSEMRHFAKQKYGLHVIDGRLPGSVVDQGLDVLAVTEYIHVFITHYTYNINEQLFIQRENVTEGRHLQTLHIRHIANSIRTHGTGILHTAVNYVYKCLLRKLSVLSQFLSNEQIKSQLVREAKFVQKQKEEHKLEYPFSRAEQLVREIKKLGAAEDGNSFLFKFCQLVAEIGNTLGFMRMMRSGGLRAVADAALYLPLLEVKSVAPLSHCLTTAEENSNTPADRVDRDDDDEVVRQLTRGCTLDASQHVDQLAHIITEKMSDGSDFFQLLQDALGRRLRTGEKYHHLRLFYLLVPSMCIDFVAYLVREKEQLVKKNKEGVFTDDGFALGCSFLISLFGVQEPFQSLHWFDTVRQHFIDHLSEIEKLVQGQATHHHRYRDNEAGNVDAAYLTRAVVEMNLKQHVEVEEAFTSSRVFFYKYNSEFSAEADDFGEVSDIDDENTEYSSVA